MSEEIHNGVHCAKTLTCFGPYRAIIKEYNSHKEKCIEMQHYIHQHTMVHTQGKIVYDNIDVKLFKHIRSCWPRFKGLKDVHINFL